MLCCELIQSVKDGKYDKRLETLYGKDALDAQKKRIANAVNEFIKYYGDREVRLFSTTGRSEISGNHTDHNRGCVLAASVDLDVIAVVCKTNDDIIRIKSEGFDEDVCRIGDTGRKFSSSAIICGVCDGFAKAGKKVGGFCAYTTSSVLKGSGLSSSAAFEDKVGFILSQLYNDG